MTDQPAKIGRKRRPWKTSLNLETGSLKDSITVVHLTHPNLSGICKLRDPSEHGTFTTYEVYFKFYRNELNPKNGGWVLGEVRYNHQFKSPQIGQHWLATWKCAEMDVKDFYSKMMKIRSIR